MPLITTPVEELETTGRTDTPFPEGAWIGTIDTVRSREIPTDKDGNPFKGYTSSDGELLSLQLGSNSSQAGQDDVGNRKFFTDLCIQDGDMDLTTTTTEEAWQLLNGRRNMTRLAIALGAAEMIGENGKTSWAYPSEFVDSLRAGDYDGMRVGFTVRHTTSKTNGKVYENLSGFFQAV